MIKLEWPNWLRRTGLLPVSMAVQILPPVFSTWLLSWVTGCFEKSIGCTHRAFEKFRKLRVV